MFKMDFDEENASAHYSAPDSPSALRPPVHVILDTNADDAARFADDAARFVHVSLEPHDPDASAARSLTTVSDTEVANSGPVSPTHERRSLMMRKHGSLTTTLGVDVSKAASMALADESRTPRPGSFMLSSVIEKRRLSVSDRGGDDADGTDARLSNEAPFERPMHMISFVQSKKIGFLNSFQTEQYAMKYSHFMPRLFNLVLSMGFEVGKILPSVSFCSDESQGYPTMIVAKHFSCYPFKHGQA